MPQVTSMDPPRLPDEARLTWISAADVGRTRAVVIALITIAILLLIVLSIAAIVRVRRGRRALPALAAETGAMPATGDPDAYRRGRRERSFHPQTARLSVPPRPACRSEPAVHSPPLTPGTSPGRSRRGWDGAPG